MSFCMFESEIALCNGNEVYLFDISTKKERRMLLSNFFSEDPRDNDDPANRQSISTVTFSNDGVYMAVCIKRKYLLLFYRDTLKHLSSRTLVRAASKIRFTPENDIVVADRTGDVYLYSTEELAEKPSLLLGHLSMLLDVMVTSDSKHIISADRDEKIRISMFPNSYNIVSYCLGHTKFVTNVAELPKPGHIISGGGDGFLRIWKYETGTEVQSINYAEKFLDEDVKEFNESLKNHDVEEPEVSMPVKHLRICKTEKGTLVLVSFYSSRRIFVYKLVDGASGWDVTFVHDLEADDEPLDCFWQEERLWVLTHQDVTFYEWKEQGYVKTDDEMLNKPKEDWQKMRNNVKTPALFPVLYKRKYDNLQDYQERKKLRLDKCN